jgi:GT2 family glycosyltransferase
MNKNKKLTIIIVTFESSAIISDCLNKINFEKHNVIVVDNSSKDNTIKIIEKAFPKASLIKLNQNIGYGRANNAALKEVKTQYSLILNPDAFIEEDNLDALLGLMDGNKKCALGAPLLLKNYPVKNEDIKEQKNIVAGNLIKQIANKSSVRYVIGAIVLLRMSVFNKIGFYDEDTFMFYEDDEICHRTIQNNYDWIVFDNIHGFHVGGGSSNKTFRNIYKRNLHLYLSKLRWKKKRKGYIKALKSSLRLIIVNIFCATLNITNYKKLANNLGFISGSLCFLLNLKPFKKNGEARG